MHFLLLILLVIISQVGLCQESLMPSLCALISTLDICLFLCYFHISQGHLHVCLPINKLNKYQPLTIHIFILGYVLLNPLRFGTTSSLIIGWLHEPRTSHNSAISFRRKNSILLLQGILTLPFFYHIILFVFVLPCHVILSNVSD